jgi:hypothetical protein
MNEIVEHRALESRNPHVLKAIATRRAVVGTALGLLPVALWCLTHRYHGLIGDSELYAMQALSRTETGLQHDVFLSSASQDHYTVFSPFYSVFIGLMGVRAAAVLLLVLFKVCFYAAAWAFIRKVCDARTAHLAVAVLIVIPGDYGSYLVFHLSEDMLTARTLAEALGMSALCLHFYGRRTWALVIGAAALCVHALMAMPILLCLLGLRLSAKADALWALAIVAATLGAACAAVMLPYASPRFFALMDPSWLELVRERSQFVFMQFWRLADWELNARPFISLALSMLVLTDGRIRSLGACALLVGAVGLAVAFIASGIGPVAVLLQAQVWRWVWVPLLVSSLLVVPTVVHMWRTDRCGPFCAVLLLIGWLFSAIDGVYCVAAALCLWAGRRHVPRPAGPYLNYAAIGLGLTVVAWIVGNSWSTLSLPQGKANTQTKALLLAQSLMSRDCLPLIVASMLWYLILRSRSIYSSGAIALALAAVTAVAAPNVLRDPRPEGGAGQIEEFSDWRAVIPPTANVFVVSTYYSAGFAWFTLERPSYLTVDQSSGVIFSLATAVEIRRRSEVLKPLEEPDWRLLSRRSSAGGKYDARAQPLNEARLIAICSDPALDFVVAHENVGFDPLRHDHAGPWKDWLLYDCKRVTSLAKST